LEYTRMLIPIILSEAKNLVPRVDAKLCSWLIMSILYDKHEWCAPTERDSSLRSE
jgi:hypothetical protein